MLLGTLRTLWYAPWTTMSKGNGGFIDMFFVAYYVSIARRVTEGKKQSLFPTSHFPLERQKARGSIIGESLKGYMLWSCHMPQINELKMKKEPISLPLAHPFVFLKAYSLNWSFYSQQGLLSSAFILLEVCSDWLRQRWRPISFKRSWGSTVTLWSL